MSNRTLLALPLAMMLLGCEEQPVGLGSDEARKVVVPAAAAVNAPVYWNEVARTSIAQTSSSPYVAARTYAMVSIAQYNAAAAAAAAPRGNRNTAVRAAITRASVDVLKQIFPSRALQLEELGSEFIAANRRPEDRPEEEELGDAAGAEAAAAVIQSRVGDGFNVPWSGTLPVGPGIWYSGAVPPAPPVQPFLGQARPFILQSGNQFRPAPPPEFGSPEYLAALAEVRAFADTRTPSQDSIAKFWALPGGTYTPLGFWNDEGSRLAVRFRLTDIATAHLLALLNIVGADALIASHDAKYAYWLLRPSQADPGIQLAIGLPNFPSYVSNHSTLSAGMARILGAEFPSERARLDALAEEASMSRLFGGIHYRFDNEVGIQLGRTIAAWALERDVREGLPFGL